MSDMTDQPEVTPFDPASPERYPRRALVCLTGLTPQVASETLYALLTARPPFVPTELHVVSTSEGARRAVELLVGGPDGGGVLARLWQDHAPAGAPVPAFDPASHVHLISEGDTVLADVTQRGHHVGTADSVLAALRPLLSDPGLAVHASIAGGRKSMSFYMGYVMSLLAREQDRLSHVLVNAPFDTLPAFTHPPREPVALPLPGGGHISTAEARVGLAEIAFVKISSHLPQQLLSGQHSFESLVRQAQAALQGVRVTIDAPRRRVAVTGPAARAEIGMTPMELGLYAYLALRRQRSGTEEGERAAEGLVLFRAETADGAPPLPAAHWLSRLEGTLGLHAGQLRRDWVADGALRERVSGINRRLRDALAEGLYTRVRVFGPKDRGVRDGRYGLLGLAPADIHFGMT